MHTVALIRPCRLVKTEGDTLSAIARDYRIELSREVAGRGAVDAEAVANLVKTRLDAMRG